MQQNKITLQKNQTACIKLANDLEITDSNGKHVVDLPRNIWINIKSYGEKCQLYSVDMDIVPNINVSNLLEGGSQSVDLTGYLFE